MRDTLLALYRLQEIDSKALEIDRGAGQIPARIRELEGQLNELRTALGAARAELDGKTREQHDAEGLIRDESAKLQKWKRRLVDIKTPREYQALSREVEQGERQVRELEEKVVTLMGEIEQQQLVVNDKEAALRARESEASVVVKELRERAALLARESAEAKTGRGDLVKKIPEKVLALYDRIRDRRGGVAVALVTNGSCAGCNVAIRPQLLVEIRKLDSLHQCPSCSRILVLDALTLSSTASTNAS